MIWAINPDSSESPASFEWCPVVAQDANDIISPAFPYPDTAPSFTEVDSTSGWLA